MLLATFGIVFIAVFIFIFSLALRDNVNAGDEVRVNIPTGSSIDDVAGIMSDAGVLQERKEFCDHITPEIIGPLRQTGLIPR